MIISLINLMQIKRSKDGRQNIKIFFDAGNFKFKLFNTNVILISFSCGDKILFEFNGMHRMAMQFVTMRMKT